MTVDEHHRSQAMTKIAYLQCPTGIAGDMCLGALVDAGVPVEYLQTQLARLGIAQEYKLWTEQVQRNGLQATKFHVELVTAAGASLDPDDFTTFDHFAHQHWDRGAIAAREGQTPPELAPQSQPVKAGQSPAESRETLPSDHSHSPLPPPAPESQPHYPPIRHLPEIERLILQAELPPRATAWSLAVFRQLAEAEGAVHGLPPEQVHFHEVGATDALVDIIGTCLGFDWLQVDAVYCSPLPVGDGFIRAAHGRLPVPSPAVLKLFELGQIPIFSNGVGGEMVTPTGAAIALTLAAQFGPPPPMRLHKVGLGAGSQNLAIPNMLRLWLGEAEGDRPLPRQQPAHIHSHPRHDHSHHDHSHHDHSHHDHHPGQAHVQAPGAPEANGVGPSVTPAIASQLATEAIAELTTQIDDLSPQAIGYVLEALLAAGAVDVFSQAIAMKKSRPGILLTVLCPPAAIEPCEAIIFRETTTLGIRRSLQTRRILPRAFQTVQTPYGPVAVKLAWATDQAAAPTNVQPEYEDCARLARQLRVPWREVHRAAISAWHQAQAQALTAAG